MNFTLGAVGSPDDMLTAMRDVSILGDRSIKPYAESPMTIGPVQISDLVPLSRYVLQGQLHMIQSLQRNFLAAGQDLWKLRGLMEWSIGSDRHTVGPPVVEVTDDGQNLLVDGAHRVWTARSEGVTEINCVTIRQVSLPLVTLPCDWKEVVSYAPGSVPAEEDKRHFRYQHPDEVRREYSGNSELVTDENFRYFFFRDLRFLGSSGVRSSRHM